MNDYQTGEHDDSVHDDSFEDDELMQKVAHPPDVVAASAEQIERTWEAIEAHIADQKVVAFPASQPWSRQLLKVAALLVVGFGAAWFAAGRGWLPLTPPPQVAGDSSGTTEPSPDRAWLAANDYGDRLEALLLAVAHGADAGDRDVAQAAREVSRGLLDDSRFYQRVARRNGDPIVSDLLARVEIVLLALATAPEGEEQEAVSALRAFIGDSDLLGEIRAVRSSAPNAPRRVPTGS